MYLSETTLFLCLKAPGQNFSTVIFPCYNFVTGYIQIGFSLILLSPPQENLFFFFFVFFFPPLPFFVFLFLQLGVRGVWSLLSFSILYTTIPKTKAKMCALYRVLCGKVDMKSFILRSACVENKCLIYPEMKTPFFFEMAPAFFPIILSFFHY